MSQVVVLVTNNAVPQPALAAAPTITIARLDTDAEVVSDTAMTSVVRGLWRYDFVQDPTLEYAFLIDADPLASGQVTDDERYAFGTLSGTDIQSLDNVDVAVSTRATQVSLDAMQVDVTAILADTSTNIPALITALNDLSVADVQTAMTNQGYTAPRAVLLDNLDVTVSSRSSHSAADVDTQLSGTHGAGAWTTADLTGVLAAIGALNDISAADVTAAVWGITEAALAAAGETGELLLFGNTLRSDIDFSGNDALGWQLVVYDRNNTEIARANLFDEAFARIPGTFTVADFITAKKAVASVDII